jgi:DNA processing protein
MDMISGISIEDQEYPQLLREIHDPPKTIYVRGDIEILNKSGVAVVGTRKASDYGIRAAEEIIKNLPPGFVIVSGLALGIDTVAHRAALKNNIPTIAVLGSSVDDQSIYPRENAKLAYEIIAKGGAVISEYEPPSPPQKQNFPKRNRIVSGLSRAVIVVEAPEKSGALITARCALEQNRDVFALPGSVFSENSKGTNNLIKQGAHPIISFKEIIEELEHQEKLAI